MLVGVELFLYDRRLGLGEKQVKIVSQGTSQMSIKTTGALYEGIS